MKEPIEPNKEDCCGSGCNPCVFDVYEKQLLLYKKYQNDENSSETLKENIISQLKYTQFIVKDNLQLCKEHYLLIFEAKLIDCFKEIWWKPGDHFLIKYTSGELSCSRPYTPLKVQVRSGSEFSVIVKKYDKGFVSQYLGGLIPGQETLWRGPFGVYDITPNKFDRIVLIAQGTGIAPFISIIEAILRNEEDMTRILLLYCCQNKESILFREELYSWKEFWNYAYSIYLNNGNKDDVYKYHEPIVSRRLNTDLLVPFQPFIGKNQILLCGSSQFMAYYYEYFKAEGARDVLLF